MKIGVAMDFSKPSKHALNWVLDNMAEPQDQVILVTIGGSNKSSKPTAMIPLSDMGKESVMKEYGITMDVEVMERLKNEVESKGLSVMHKVLYGDARDRLCDVVQEVPLDCLVMGSRGLGTVKRTLLGSVSSHVINYASCPVTVVKLPPKKKSSQGCL